MGTPRPVRADLTRSFGALPAEFAAIMRPELPSLIQETIAEIRRSIPEYAQVLDGPYARAVPLIVEANLATFVEKVASPDTPTAQRDKVCRMFGRFEAYEGRELDTMEATFRIGARVALRRAKRTARRYGHSTTLMLAFADALFAYMDELVDVAREGYLEARAELDNGQDTHRQRLLAMILQGPAAPRSALAELAERARWPLPDEVTLIAYSAEKKPDRGAIPDDVLLDLDDPQPHGLIPGPMDDDRRALLRATPAHVRFAIGVTVPLAAAPESLRWARRTLALVEAGILPEQPYTYADDHLVTLWLFSDPALLELLSRRRLAPLDDLTPNQRDRLIDTLRAWLDTRGNAVQMAELLHLHPQTVRYRLRNLDKAFGAQLTDPDARFALELVLRALQLRGRRGYRVPQARQDDSVTRAHLRALPGRE
ncbi:PucR family transcriptional regulator [Streptomyces sp. A7024]|uniref:PucR family transcriptional regulator n=1 Tax=Streptomyces coryli TaxID=1128680 RepID=A0A6G4UBI2_9ACTN|nr:PucR family transcriptional regulator [Streptomyces coryli]NGN68687.1 PucR family transcriptional regulator [Streptomyces coryli]